MIPPDDPRLIERLRRAHQRVVSLALVDLRRAWRLAQAVINLAARFPRAPLVQAQAHWTYASAIIYRPDYAGALRHYRLALHHYREACVAYAPSSPPLDVQVVYIPLVFCLTELGQYQEAFATAAAAEQWLASQQMPYATLTLLLNQSLLAGRSGDYYQMVKLADETIRLAAELGAVDREAQGWINRGHACSFLGALDEADEALQHGLTRAARAAQPLTLARAQWNYARLLRIQGRLFDALTTLSEARRGLTQAPGEAATVALEEASLYAQLRQLPEAQDAAQRAAIHFDALGMPAYSADAALRAARLAVEQQLPDDAVDLLTFATAQASRTALPALNAEIELARASLALLEVPEARAVARGPQRREALRIAQGAVGRLRQVGLVSEADAGDLIVAALSARVGTSARARAIYRRLARSADRQLCITALTELSRLLPSAKALPHLQRAADLAHAARRALPAEELQARYSSEMSPHHLALAACQLELGEADRAVQNIWIAKAGVLLDLRSTSTALDDQAVRVLADARVALALQRAHLREQRRRARSVAERVTNAQLHDPTTQVLNDEAHAITQLVRRAEAELHASEQRVSEVVRTLRRRDGQTEAPAIGELQAALAPDAALLEFAVIDGKLLGALIRPGHPPDIHWLGPILSLTLLHDQWVLVRRRLMHNPATGPLSREEIRRALAPFCDTLLTPWRKALAQLSHLIIAPCDVLYQLPWMALDAGGGPLGERLTLELTPSGGLYAAPLAAPAVPPGPPRVLGHPGPEDQLLIHVEAELGAVSQHLPGALVRYRATSQDLRAPPTPRILHIAAHAVTRPRAPICSSIELADGPLLLVEAHRLRLHGTELVTLSACETAVRPDYGDMTLALAGAFLCAGARAVVASLWKVSDVAAARLMERFYAELDRGQHPARALRHAQLAIRDDHPLDWSAFQLWSGTSS